VSCRCGGHPCECCDEVKRCACGARYSLASWRRLVRRGVMQLGEDAPALELRDCACGSTIALEIAPATVRAVLGVMLGDELAAVAS
jgi:hypothetical protein